MTKEQITNHQLYVIYQSVAQGEKLPGEGKGRNVGVGASESAENDIIKVKVRCLHDDTRPGVLLQSRK